jgi:sugar phosphate permease
MKTVLKNPANESSDATRTQSEMRKRWLIILPAVFVTYSLAYIDRTNYGFGAAAGLADTLHISGSRSALLGALFFLGYFLFQIPGVAYAKRSSTRVLIFVALIVWGVLASLTGVIRNFWLLALDRTLLGVAESFVFPAMLILLTNWFTRAERSRTNSFPQPKRNPALHSILLLEPGRLWIRPLAPEHHPEGSNQWHRDHRAS